jgi:hypothetical protein
MFDLEKSIAEWRKQMLAAGIKTPALVEELESHLRNEIERQMKSGINSQLAFEESVQQIGPPDALRSEFQKANALTVGQKRPLAIVGGVLTGLVGFVLVWATVIQGRDMGKMTGEAVVLFVLGLILVFNGAAISYLASKRSFLASYRKAWTRS